MVVGHVDLNHGPHPDRVEVSRLATNPAVGGEASIPGICHRVRCHQSDMPVAVGHWGTIGAPTAVRSG
jgi:hypothetical protein